MALVTVLVEVGMVKMVVVVSICWYCSMLEKLPKRLDNQEVLC